MQVVSLGGLGDDVEQLLEARTVVRNAMRDLLSHIFSVLGRLCGLELIKHLVDLLDLK